MSDHRPDGGYETRISYPADGTIDGGWRRMLSIAAVEYRLAVRGRWAIALTVLFATFTLLMATFSGASVAPAGYERTVASLAALAAYLVPLVALAFGYDAIVGRAESGWLDALFALPVARSRVLIGMYLGRATVFVAATVLGFGLPGLLLLWEFGFASWTIYLQFMVVTAGVGLVFLAIALLVSTLVREKAHALGLALLAWAWFVLVHDLLALGVISAFELPDIAITAMVLSNPASIFRLLVLAPLIATGEGGFAAVLAVSGLSIGLLIAALIAWIVVPLGLAAAVVGRRSV